jgi:hypothetical protein
MAFFGRKDSMWGGETLTCGQTRPRLHVKKGDKFRVERGPLRKLTVIPHPDNKGTWNQTHSKANPVIVNPKEHKPTSFKRAYAMKVTTKKGTRPKKLFLVERQNGFIAITRKAIRRLGGGHDEDTASVER